MKRLSLCLILAALLVVTTIGTRDTRAQDAVDLPTELYVLLNSGVIQRVGLGTAGVTPVTPEDLFILDFAVAPNNTLLAYRTEDGVYTLPLYREEGPAQVDDAAAGLPPLRGRGQSMAWSPDGDAIAYTTAFGVRVHVETPTEPFYADLSVNPVQHLVWSPQGTYLAAESEGGIWWVFRRDGLQIDLAAAIPQSSGLAWVDDSRLIFAPPEGGLTLMDLSAANAQTPLASDGFYSLPFVGVDGVLQAFLTNAFGAEEGVLRRWQWDGQALTPIDTSESVVELTALRWAPGGDLLLGLRGGVPAAVLASTGQGFAPPVSGAVAYGWGATRPPSVSGFRTSYEGFFLALDILTGVQQVHRLPRNGLQPQPLTFAESDITAYAVAPDGRAIAYAAGGQVFAAPLDPAGTAGDATALSDPLETGTVIDMAFDPSGTTIAYTVDTDGVRTINTAPVNAGESPSALTTSPLDAFNPRYAPDGSSLLVTMPDGEAIYEIAAGNTRMLGAFTWADWLQDGRVAAVRVDASGAAEVVVIDPNTPDVAPLLVLRAAQSSVHDLVEIAPGRLRLLLASRVASGYTALTLVEVRVDSGEPDEVASLPPMVAPLLAPDGQYAAGFTQPGGALVVYSATEGAALTLARPVTLERFQWATFR